MDAKNGTSLRADIIKLLAVSIRANRESLILLRGDTPYLWKTVSQMKSESIIKVNKNPEWSLRLTSKGVRELAVMNEPLCDFYLRFSCGNRPGSTDAHKKAQFKAAEMTALMMRMGVAVGTDKPSRGAPSLERMDSGSKAFYLMKELKADVNQKINRTQVSRATGIILSPAINALVYNTQGEVMGMNGTAERTTNYQVTALRQDVFIETTPLNVGRSLLVGYDYDLIRSLLNRDLAASRAKSDRKRKTAGDAIFDRTITGTDMLYVPSTGQGELQLALTLTFTQDQLKRLAFREEELLAGDATKECEAFVGDLRCFEMISMNLSKLARVLRIYEDSLPNVGLVCMESQSKVFDPLVRDYGIRLRIIKDSAFRQALQKHGG